MHWDKIGNYLDRDVNISHLKYLSEYSVDKVLSKSLLLLYFCEVEDFKSDDLLPFFKTIAKEAPLAIILSGYEAERRFDTLLESVSNLKTSDHIMTGFIPESDINDLLDDFLGSTWPAKERHTEWKYYSIIQIGLEKIKSDFFEVLK